MNEIMISIQKRMLIFLFATVEVYTSTTTDTIAKLSNVNSK